MHVSRLGSYVVRRRLGAGGMGVVYEAEHELMHRVAAVKVLAPAFAGSPEKRQRFLNEARAAAAIKHPNVVDIYDVGQTDDGTIYLAMEVMDGESLDARIARGPLDGTSALSIAHQIAVALSAAHAKGIVHRDLTPGNVFVLRESPATDRPRIKLLDFGLARRLATNEPGVTRPGAIVGTPLYMSPEQCQGSPADHRADLYALGCILFAMVSGRPPFLPSTVDEALKAHVLVPPPRLSSLTPVSRALDDLVSRLLMKAADARPPTAAAVADTLGWLETESRVGDATIKDRFPPGALVSTLREVAPEPPPAQESELTQPTNKLLPHDDAPTLQKHALAQLAALAEARFHPSQAAPAAPARPPDGGPAMPPAFVPQAPPMAAALDVRPLTSRAHHRLSSRQITLIACAVTLIAAAIAWLATSAFAESRQDGTPPAASHSGP